MRSIVMKNITTIINIKNIYNKCERLSTVRFLVQIVLVPKAASLEYEFQKQLLHLKKFYHTGTSI